MVTLSPSIPNTRESTIPQRRVLVVEDEAEIRQLIVLHLRREGFDVREAADGELARQMIASLAFDLVVMDWMLPTFSGLELTKWIRRHELSGVGIGGIGGAAGTGGGGSAVGGATGFPSFDASGSAGRGKLDSAGPGAWAGVGVGSDVATLSGSSHGALTSPSMGQARGHEQGHGVGQGQGQREGIGQVKVQGQVPILFVTAKTDPEQIATGLDAGADDYLTKPFDTLVLMARVNALLRRREWLRNQLSTSNTHALKLGELSLDTGSFEATLAGEKLELTRSEFRLLECLMLNQGKVCSRESLIEQIQGEGVNVVGRTVDTHVFGLRKKMGDFADIIETIRGVGYRVSNSPPIDSRNLPR